MSKDASGLDLSDVGSGKDNRALILFRVLLTLVNALSTSGRRNESRNMLLVLVSSWCKLLSVLAGSKGGPLVPGTVGGAEDNA